MRKKKVGERNRGKKEGWTKKIRHRKEMQLNDPFWAPNTSQTFCPYDII